MSLRELALLDGRRPLPLWDVIGLILTLTLTLMRSTGLVGRVMSLLHLVLSLEWCISVLLYHISHQVPRLTEIESPDPVKGAASFQYPSLLSGSCIPVRDAAEFDSVPH
jgi:hypothetical protein